MQMLMSGNPMAMMGGNNNMSIAGNSGANTPNGNQHVQPHQHIQQSRRSPQKVTTNGLPIQQGLPGQPQQSKVANLGQGNGNPPENQNSERTSSKRKLDELSDGGKDSAKGDDEARAPKQIRTQ